MGYIELISFYDLIETRIKLCSDISDESGAPLLDATNSRIMIWRIPTAGVKKVELIFKNCCSGKWQPTMIVDLKIHYSNL